MAMEEIIDINGDMIPINKLGAFVNENGMILNEEIKISAYKQIIPESFDSTVIISICFMIVGFITIYLIEKFAERQNIS